MCCTFVALFPLPTCPPICSPLVTFPNVPRASYRFCPFVSQLTIPRSSTQVLWLSQLVLPNVSNSPHGRGSCGLLEPKPQLSGEVTLHSLYPMYSPLLPSSSVLCYVPFRSTGTQVCSRHKANLACSAKVSACGEYKFLLTVIPEALSMGRQKPSCQVLLTHSCPSNSIDIHLERWRGAEPVLHPL